MFSTIKLSFVAFLSIGLFATGCASQTSEDSASTDSDLAVTPGEAVAALESGTFNLFDEPTTVAPAACSVHTQLTLSNNGKSSHASLRDVVTGPCGIYVVPNVREYDLKAAANVCGSLTFQGQTTVGTDIRKISITDNRKRACEDKAEAAVIVDEIDVHGVAMTRYSAQ